MLTEFFVVFTFGVVGAQLGGIAQPNELQSLVSQSKSSEARNRSFPVRFGRWKYTLEYPERESLRTYLDAAQRMVLQLLLQGGTHLGLVRERRTNVQGDLRRERVGCWPTNCVQCNFENGSFNIERAFRQA